tara:strand:- start:169 stop:1410 length:1242 start_codon:yes stop_codon:yes gene_type:complete
LSDKQLQFIDNAVADINIAEGAVRSGKTVAANLRWAEYISDVPIGSLLLMTGKTTTTLRRNVLEEFMFDFWTEQGSEFSFNRSSQEIHIDGRKIVCVGANDERAEDKLKGLTVAGWYADEVTTYPESFTTQALARCSGWPGLSIWTCNPDAIRHYINSKFLEKGVDKVYKLHFGLEDNPGLSKEYIDRLKTMFSGLYYKRLVQGLWCAAEGAIYDMFDPSESFHVEQVPLKYDRLVVGIDYGTSNPCTYGLFQCSGGKAYQVDEWRWNSQERGRQKTDEEYGDDLVTWLAGRSVDYVIIDPSAASLKVVLRRLGFQVRDGNNDVSEGIKHVSSMLRQGKAHICDTCPETAKSLSGYSWDPRAQARGEDKPLKKDDHEADMFRYVLMDLLPRSTSAGVSGIKLADKHESVRAYG